MTYWPYLCLLFGMFELFQVQQPKLRSWNSFPREVVTATSLCEFKPLSVAFSHHCQAYCVMLEMYSAGPGAGLDDTHGSLST